MVGQVYKPTNKSVVEKDALRTVILQTYLVGVHHAPKAFKLAYKKCGRLVERIMAKRNKHVRIIVFSEDAP